ncbi:hypothetical protein H696_03938 [Fonticula alba]|uniref:Uncharacterized protein n=1 Tax=Fonticula alba TaxID=691883 RepID=A0A058Z7P2_FONAL|nr:hypothetical protein H696_03938 [Fonticula alba]KCV69517.1 hypothetical protein H696_03938 [Fonticula alba]|eukprot:XP_009496082.1 hypothetical protein H696_03938 [Fonticula alba]
MVTCARLGLRGGARPMPALLTAALLASLALVLLLAPHHTGAVDRRVFKNCSQSGFCRRMRRVGADHRRSLYSTAHKVPFSESLHQPEFLVDEAGLGFASRPPPAFPNTTPSESGSTDMPTGASWTYAAGAAYAVVPGSWTLAEAFVQAATNASEPDADPAADFLRRNPANDDALHVWDAPGRSHDVLPPGAAATESTRGLGPDTLLTFRVAATGDTRAAPLLGRVTASPTGAVRLTFEDASPGAVPRFSPAPFTIVNTPAGARLRVEHLPQAGSVPGESWVVYAGPAGAARLARLTDDPACSEFPSVEACAASLADHRPSSDSESLHYALIISHTPLRARLSVVVPATGGRPDWSTGHPAPAATREYPASWPWLEVDRLLEINAQERLWAELSRNKTTTPPAGSRSDRFDDDGAWEEDFLEFHDPKPRGPQAVSVDVTFPGFYGVFGIPEHASDFALQDTFLGDPYRLYNLDVFQYVLDSPMALYGSVPLMIAHGHMANRPAARRPRRSVGLLLLNASEMWVDVAHRVPCGSTSVTPLLPAPPVSVVLDDIIMDMPDDAVRDPSDSSPRPTPPVTLIPAPHVPGGILPSCGQADQWEDLGVDSHWFAEAGHLDMVMFPSFDPPAAATDDADSAPTATASVLRQFTHVTGRPQLPPIWGLGQHQSRWNYNDQTDLQRVDAMFDAHALPNDVLWLDIEHTDRKCYLSWDRGRFPDPVAMQQSFAFAGGARTIREDVPPSDASSDADASSDSSSASDSDLSSEADSSSDLSADLPTGSAGEQSTAVVVPGAGAGRRLVTIIDPHLRAGELPPKYYGFGEPRTEQSDETRSELLRQVLTARAQGALMEPASSGGVTAERPSAPGPFDELDVGDLLRSLRLDAGWSQYTRVLDRCQGDADRLHRLVLDRLDVLLAHNGTGPEERSSTGTIEGSAPSTGDGGGLNIGPPTPPLAPGNDHQAPNSGWVDGECGIYEASRRLGFLVREPAPPAPSPPAPEPEVPSLPNGGPLVDDTPPPSAEARANRRLRRRLQHAEEAICDLGEDNVRLLARGLYALADMVLRQLDHRSGGVPVGFRDFHGQCWPGRSSWPDVLRPEVRRWWSSRLRLDRGGPTEDGVYGASTPWLFVWNDMNEPSVFSGPEITMPKELLHGGGATGLPEWEHREVHNLYGLLHHATTYASLLHRELAGFSVARAPARPFVLSRSFFAGSQRFGAIWTGDNESSYSHMSSVAPFSLSLGFGGFPFSGSDVGGFFADPDNELIARWYQSSVFSSPFFRVHAHMDTRRREPWTLTEPFLSSIRLALDTRYQLLPYWYTLMYRAHLTGEPALRPVFWEFNGDDLQRGATAAGAATKGPSMDEGLLHVCADAGRKAHGVPPGPGDSAMQSAGRGEHLLGPALLVRPIHKPTNQTGLQGAPDIDPDTGLVDVLLPGLGSGHTRWYDYWSLRPMEAATGQAGGLGRGDLVRVPVSAAAVPVFLRGGQVLARKDRPRRSSVLSGADPYTLVVGLPGVARAGPGGLSSTGGRTRCPLARGEIYLDDGWSEAHRAHFGGAWARKRHELTVDALPPAGQGPSTAVLRLSNADLGPGAAAARQSLLRAASAGPRSSSSSSSTSGSRPQDEDPVAHAPMLDPRAPVERVVILGATLSRAGPGQVAASLRAFAIDCDAARHRLGAPPGSPCPDALPEESSSPGDWWWPVGIDHDPGRQWLTVHRPGITISGDWVLVISAPLEGYPCV